MLIESEKLDCLNMSDESLANVAVGRTTKKVRRRLEEPPDSDDPVVNEKGVKVDDSGKQSLSWKR